LVGSPGDLPAPRAASWHRALFGDRVLGDGLLDELCGVLERQRGIIVAGAGAGDPAGVHAFADSVGWPVLADPRSGCRLPRTASVAAFDALLRHVRFASDHAPEVVLRLGFAPASKVLNQWIVASGATQVQVHATPQWIDADHVVALRVVADPGALCGSLVGRVKGAAGTTWPARWRHAEGRAQAALDTAAEGAPALTEPAVARVLTAALPSGASLVVSSSMPVRDVEWYGAARDGLIVHANRGANGIDGVTSTAVGVALADPTRPTALLIGDLAFLHDTNGLLALRDRHVRLTIVVVDNRGGAIFSFLPQRSLLPLERYEQLFGTPAHTDPAAVAAAHGLDVEEVATVAELRSAVAHAGERSGVRVLVVRSDRDTNVEAHDAVHRAVAAALDRL
jgi:2-succinyl-5-enolpyruvyl-6-hydroxy-3-cyclohexene-1-carboxylate synthase